MPEKSSDGLIASLFPKPKQIRLIDSVFSFPIGSIVARDLRNKSVRQSAVRIQAKMELLGHRYPIAEKAENGRNPAVQVSIDQPPGHIQGSRIAIEPGSIRLSGNDEEGLAHAVTTFTQIVAHFERDGVVPGLEIIDWPDYEKRGIMLDISRDKIPTMETLFRLVDQCAAWKLNELQLYTEHTFAYSNHRKVWEDASPMTPDEITELDTYCRERHIELVPNQNTFGHLERWLKHDAYAHLAECRNPTKVFAWGEDRIVSRRSLCPVDPGALALMNELFAELLPNFSSRNFNIGCDETIELGYGRSKEACENEGKGQVYLDYLLGLRQAAEKHGRRIQFWGDIITNYPELIPKLPKDITALIWGYEKDHPFDKECSEFKASGLDFYVCPGTSSWNSLVGRHGNATKNLLRAARSGAAHGAKGYLITDWGDGGHWQPLCVPYPYFAYGAALSWGPDENEGIDLARHLNQQVYHDREGRIGGVLLNLAKAAEYSEIFLHNSSIFDPILRRAADRFSDLKPLEKLRPENLQRIDESLEAELNLLAEARLTCDDADQVVAETRLAAEFCRHACKQAQYKLGTPGGYLKEVPIERRRELRRELRGLIKRFEKLWLIRNRSGGLADSVGRLEKILEAY
jgi:hypothetical protein